MRINLPAVFYVRRFESMCQTSETAKLLNFPPIRVIIP